jgi:hypothetical protein
MDQESKRESVSFNWTNTVNMSTSPLIEIFMYHTCLPKLGHVKWVPCHHGMARTYVSDAGDGLRIWRVAANILNKQSRTADRGGPPAWGLGGMLTNSH